MVSQKPKYNFERNSHWRKLSMIMVWERYCNASPKQNYFYFLCLYFHSYLPLIWVCLGWNFHRWFSIQKQVNWCIIDPFTLKFCTSQHSYPVPLKLSPKSHARKFSRNGVGLGYLMVVTGFAWQLQGLRGYYGVYTAHTGQEGCHAPTPLTSQVSPNSQYHGYNLPMCR